MLLIGTGSWIAIVTVVVVLALLIVGKIKNRNSYR
jgi:hypothetical protein